MSIDKRPNGRWRVRYPGVRSKTFDRKSDAEDYERRVRRLKQTGRLDTLEAGEKTLAELAAEHMTAEAGHLADNTKATYRSLWAAHVDSRILDQDGRDWSHPIASTPIAQIRARTVEEWRDDRLSDGAGAQAIRKTMALMQTIFDRAVRDEAVPSNPVRSVKKPSGARAGSISVIDPKAVERIRAELDDTGRMLVSVLAYSGIRPGEARALEWRHVGQKTLRIEQATNPDGTVKATKTKHNRSVPLCKPLADDLKAWRKQQGDPPETAFVFPRAREGDAWKDTDWRNWRKRHFNSAAADAGVKIGRPYDLRHSIASLWLHEGKSAVQVAAWLGHNVSQTHDTYAHVVAEVDPDDKTTVEDRIKAARQDTSRTHGNVQRGKLESKRRRRKPRARAKSALAA